MQGLASPWQAQVQGQAQGRLTAPSGPAGTINHTDQFSCRQAAWMGEALTETPALPLRLASLHRHLTGGGREGRARFGLLKASPIPKGSCFDSLLTGLLVPLSVHSLLLWALSVCCAPLRQTIHDRSTAHPTDSQPRVRLCLLK